MFNNKKNKKIRKNNQTKLNYEASADAATDEATTSQKPLTTIAERNKPLSAHMQQTINRLSMPKKPSIASEEAATNLNTTTTMHHRSGTPQLEEAHNNEQLTSVATSSSNSLTLIKKVSVQELFLNRKKIFL